MTLAAWRKRGNQVRSLGGASLIERAKAAFRHEPRIVTLVSTRDPGIALRLFEDAGFPWRLQGQVADVPVSIGCFCPKTTLWTCSGHSAAEEDGDQFLFCMQLETFLGR